MDKQEEKEVKVFCKCGCEIKKGDGYIKNGKKICVFYYAFPKGVKIIS